MWLGVPLHSCHEALKASRAEWDGHERADGATRLGEGDSPYHDALRPEGISAASGVKLDFCLTVGSASVRPRVRSPWTTQTLALLGKLIYTGRSVHEKRDERGERCLD